MFDGIPEGQQQKKHIEFANDLRMIRIETTSGLRFYLESYPSFGWMYGTGMLSYFSITPELSSWIQSNLK